jgi:hypothetical protein
MRAATEPKAPTPLPVEVKPDPTGAGLCLLLQVNTLGNKRRMPGNEYECEAEKAMTRAEKQLIDAPELRAIKTLDARIKAWLNLKCLPPQASAKYGLGVRLVPLYLVEEVDAEIEKYIARRAELADALAAAYTLRVEEAKLKLRGQWKAKDYKTPEEVRASCYVTKDYFASDAPNSLAQIGADFFAKEQARAQAKWADALDAASRVLRENMRDLVQTFCGKLAGKKDGAPKKIKPEAVAKLNDFLDTFGKRNLANDAELATLVAQARALVDGVDADTLMAVENVRTVVAKGFDAIKDQLDLMVVAKPRRMINLDDT